jgi:hypothetical protein
MKKSLKEGWLYFTIYVHLKSDLINGVAFLWEWPYKKGTTNQWHEGWLFAEMAL